jgi:hypothetical protein
MTYGHGSLGLAATQPGQAIVGSMSWVWRRRARLTKAALQGEEEVSQDAMEETT